MVTSALTPHTLADWITASSSSVSADELEAALLRASGAALAARDAPDEITSLDLDEALRWLRASHELVIEERAPGVVFHHVLGCVLGEAASVRLAGRLRTRMYRGLELAEVAHAHELQGATTCPCLQLAPRFSPTEGPTATRYSARLLHDACELALEPSWSPLALAQLTLELHPRLRVLDPLHSLLRDALTLLAHRRVPTLPARPDEEHVLLSLRGLAGLAGLEHEAELAALLLQGGVGGVRSVAYCCVEARALGLIPPAHRPTVFARSPRRLGGAELTLVVELSLGNVSLSEAIATLLQASAPAL